MRIRDGALVVLSHGRGLANKDIHILGKEMAQVVRWMASHAAFANK
jgi:hypothetical protein